MSYFRKAENIWNNFLGEKILDYSSKRNYDYGPTEDSLDFRIITDWYVISFAFNFPEFISVQSPSWRFF